MCAAGYVSGSLGSLSWGDLNGKEGEQTSSKKGADFKENSFNLCIYKMTCIRTTLSKLPLQCKNEYKNREHLHFWNTLIPFSLPIAMREADRNSLKSAYLYCPWIFSYCLEIVRYYVALNCR